jgi:hypothetical protein
MLTAACVNFHIVRRISSARWRRQTREDGVSGTQVLQLLTVRQLIDLVAFLPSRYQLVPPMVLGIDALSQDLDSGRFRGFGDDFLPNHETVRFPSCDQLRSAGDGGN